MTSIILTNSLTDATTPTVYGVPLWTFILAVLAIVLIVAGIIVSFVLAFRKDKKISSQLIDFNVRVYQYDFANKVFSFFDQSDLRNQKCYSAKEFYSQFSASDKFRVERWLDEISQGTEDYAQFLQADIKIRRRGNSLTTSLLQLTGINREKNVIHFESRLLSYMGSFSDSNRRRRKSVAMANTIKDNAAHDKRLKKYCLADKDAASHFMDSAGPNQVIGIVSLKLYRKGPMKTADEVNLPRVNQAIISQISRYFSQTFRFLEVTSTETLLIDKDSHSKTMVVTIASNINTAATQALNLMTDDDSLHVALGITTGSLCQRDIDQAIRQTGDMTSVIANGYTTEKIMFYDPTFFQNYREEQKNLSDISLLAANGTFRLYFRASVNVKNWEQSFFHMTVKPFGTSLTDLARVLEVARKVEGGLAVKHLFQQIDDRAGRALRHSPIKSVMIEIPLRDVPTFLEVMSERESRIQWILAIRDSDFMTVLDDLSDIRLTLSRIIDHGYFFSLILSNANTMLPASIVRCASYLLVGHHYTNRLNDPKVRTDLRLIQSNYAGYNALLTYCDLKDDNGFELAVHYGAKIIQCLSLSGMSSLPERLDVTHLEELRKAARDLMPKEESPRQKDNDDTSDGGGLSLPDENHDVLTDVPTEANPGGEPESLPSEQETFPSPIPASRTEDVPKVPEPQPEAGLPDETTETTADMPSEPRMETPTVTAGGQPREPVPETVGFTPETTEQSNQSNREPVDPEQASDTASPQEPSVNNRPAVNPDIPVEPQYFPNDIPVAGAPVTESQNPPVSEPEAPVLADADDTVPVDAPDETIKAKIVDDGTVSSELPDEPDASDSSKENH